MKKTLNALLALTPLQIFAQTEENLMYSEGKIYVVIAVIGIIFLGLAGFLFRMDRKVSALENEK